MTRSKMFLSLVSCHNLISPIIQCTCKGWSRGHSRPRRHSSQLGRQNQTLHLATHQQGIQETPKKTGICRICTYPQISGWSAINRGIHREISHGRGRPILPTWTRPRGNKSGSSQTGGGKSAMAMESLTVSEGDIQPRPNGRGAQNVGIETEKFADKF